MKKSLSTLFILLLTIILSWGAISWYFGEQTEQSLNTYLNKNSKVDSEDEGNVSIELLAYKKTFLGAEAKFLMSFNHPLLKEQFGNFKLNAKIHNGPVFVNHFANGFVNSSVNSSVNRPALRIGKSQWVFELDQDSDFFQQQPEFEVVIDFDDKANYFSQGQLSIDALAKSYRLTGVYDLETEDNRGAITLKNFNWKTKQIGVSAEKILMSFQHQKRLTRAYKPGTSSIQIPALQVTSALWQKPLNISLKSNSNISIKGNELFGHIGAKLLKQDQHELPVDKADIAFHFKGLPSDAFVTLNEINSNIENLHEQAQWALEENGELPEGQDQIWQIYDQIKSLTEDKANQFFEVFNDKQSQIILEIKLNNSSGTSDLIGSLKPHQLNTKNTSFISQFKAESDVNLDNNLHQYLSKKFNKQFSLKKKTFKLFFQDNKLLMVQ